MKVKTLATLFFAVIALWSIDTARAESTDKTITMEIHNESEKQNKENLIDQIETAQKEQFLKFMKKKQNVQDSEYI